MDQSRSGEGPRIYNLFPLLVGPMPQWGSHIERARRMAFDWLFINPFQQSGHSGSLYSIKDHYTIDSRLLDPAAGAPEDQLRAMIEKVRGAGMGLMMDLVINHTAIDSPLVREHPEWYRHGPGGKLVNPGAREDDHQVIWNDLYEVDNASSSDREGLWRYWIDMAKFYGSMGFNGFRCDAAYKVPGQLWSRLIGEVKHVVPDAIFFAESLGCDLEETLALGRVGFDFIFNSSKWWDFAAPWCLEQYRQTSPVVPSISFAESHDTERLAAELDGDRQAVKMRYAFSALFSSGVMMPVGFEYGFQRALHVVKTTQADWEQPSWDITGFVAGINRLKASRRVLNEEGPIDAIDCGSRDLFAFRKSTRDGSERAFVILNKDRKQAHLCDVSRFGHEFNGASNVEDLSPEVKFNPAAGPSGFQVEPSGVRTVVAHFARR